MPTHSSILAWKIPWTEEPGDLQSLEWRSWKRLSDSMRAHVVSLYLLLREMCVQVQILQRCCRVPGPRLSHFPPQAWFINVSIQGWLSNKESACQFRRHRFDPWVGKIPWRRKWQHILVFLPGKSHGQKSLVGYGLGSCKCSTPLID